MTFETILNLVWAGFGLLAWSALGLRERPFARARWRHSVTLLLALVSLFPCVSASDDLSSPLPTVPVTSGWAVSANVSSVAPLVRMLEALQHAQVAVSFFLFLTLAFFAMAWRDQDRRQIVAWSVFSGRSPPVLS